MSKRPRAKLTAEDNLSLEQITEKITPLLRRGTEMSLSMVLDGIRRIF